jgi:hypothetical protein
MLKSEKYMFLCGCLRDSCISQKPAVVNLSGTRAKLFGWDADNMCAPPFIPQRR